MQPTSLFKKAFLKNMLMGLKLGGVFSKSKSYLEKMRAIKLSADAAMALARGHTGWSQALVANLAKQEKDKALVKGILGKTFEGFIKPCNHHPWKIPTSKKILRRSSRMHSRIRKGPSSSVIARRMVKKRTRVLKRLIPGGESLDEFSLFSEVLDYVICLQAQANMMRALTMALGASNLRSNKECSLKEKEASCASK